MNRQEKEEAEKVLRHLMVGNEIIGLTFLLPVMLNGSWKNPTEDIYLHCESNLEELAGRYVDSINFSERNRSREIELICSVKDDKIADVYLAEQVPHLVIHFESGKALIINGHDEMYETWQVNSGDVCIVACPGDEIAVWEGR